MKRWETEIHLVGSVDGKESHTTSYRSLGPRQVKEILEKIRKRDNTPKRKVSPVFSYILEELTDSCFGEYRNLTLEKIVIKDKRDA